MKGLILTKLGNAATDADREFLDYRFKRRYRNAVKAAPKFGRRAAALKIGAATLGLASAAIGALGDNIRTDLGIQITVVAIGVLVGVLAALDQTWKPGVRHANFRQTQNQLLKEGWDFVLGRGRYKKAPDLTEAFRTFVGEVCRVTQSERAGLEKSIT